MPALLDGELQAVFDLPQADVRALLRKRRMLAQPVDQELLLFASTSV